MASPDLDFVDVNLFLGRPMKGSCKSVSSGRELTAELDGFGVKKALVWHIAQHDYSAPEGNRLASKEIRDEGRLLGCWTILPPQTEEVIREDFFEKMKGNRIVALRAFPDPHRYLLNRVTFGTFLDEVSERKIPLLLSLIRGITWPAIYALMEEFPSLTCVLCDLGVWSMDRYTWPLLEQYPNLYLETSFLSLAAGGLESTVKRFGAGRLLFGSGFPERYPESAMLQLIHSEISDSDKRMIAAENTQNLLSEMEL